MIAYVTAWNTADESARRDLPERAFAADGTYADPSARVVGRAALVAHSRRYAEHTPGPSVAVTSPVEPGSAATPGGRRDG